MMRFEGETRLNCIARCCCGKGENFAFSAFYWGRGVCVQKHSAENLPRQQELPIFVVDCNCSGGAL